MNELMKRISEDDDLQKRLEALPVTFNGKLLLFFRDGKVSGFQVTESINRIVDRMPRPFAK
ncbi:MAG: hypothetical protein KGL39_26710 [Patescibacteria group bacterium]|nr:hypothetical protein [Patescibacteria group bacterium]